MNAADQLELLHTFLAEHPCPAGARVSDHVQHEAAAGNGDAQRLLAGGLFNGTGADDAAPKAPATRAPINPRAVQERAHRIETQTLPARIATREPARPIVHGREVSGPGCRSEAPR